MILVKRASILAIIFIILINLVGCSEESIELVDYESIVVPTEIKEVAEEDVLLSVRMRLREKEVIVEKISNKDVVEENDIVEIHFVENVDLDNITFIVGEQNFCDDFDEFIIGKKINRKYYFKNESVDVFFEIVGIKCFAETVTDDIAKKYFGFESKELFESYVENEIVKHRIFEYKYEILINKTKLKIDNSEMSKYISEKTLQAEKNAERAGSTLSEYLEMEYCISLSEYKTEIELFYIEYKILEELMKRERIDISENAVYHYVENLANERGIEPSEIFEFNSEEEIRYQMYYEKSFDIIL